MAAEVSWIPVDVTAPCAFCAFVKEDASKVVTHSGKVICFDCSIFHRFCEICGSTMKENAENMPIPANVKEVYNLDGQLHFDEWCVK